MRKLSLFALVVAACAIASADPQSAEDKRFIVEVYNFGYTGSMTKYGNLIDAQTQSNAISTHTFQQRDGYLNIANEEPYDAIPNRTFFGTNFWAATDGHHGDGYGNPSHQTDSFIGSKDVYGAYSTSKTGGWTSAAYDSFHINVKGKDSPYQATGARMWNGKPSGPVYAVIGSFVEYEIDYTATGLRAQGYFDGLVTKLDYTQPTGSSGYIRGIFRNESVTDPSSNGFYRFELIINSYSWAFSNPNAEHFQSTFIGPAVVPEPTSMAAVGLGLVAIARRRRRR